MTTLLDIFKDLTYGELASLKIGEMIPGEYQSEPDPTRYEQIITHVNLGLTEIYKRFFLLSREIYVELHQEISTYMLHSKYSLENTESAIATSERYIIDTAEEPFLDDVLKIEEVYDEVGVKLPMNDVEEALSIFTPSYRTFQVPFPNDDITYAVQYRANHPKIIYAREMDPSLIDVAIPNSLHEALLYYIASRAFSSLGGDSGVEGNDYFQRFENSCNKVEEYGLEVQTEQTNWRFDTRGWV